jgi:hypothetical protein
MSARPADHNIIEAHDIMTKQELVIQLAKIVLGIAIGVYFVWWSLEVLHRLPPH